MIDIEHDHRQRQAITLSAIQLDLEPLLEIAPVMNTGQRVGHRQRTQLLLHPLEVGDVGQVAMPKGTPRIADLWCRFAAHPAQARTRQADPVLLAPRREVVGRVAHRPAYAVQVIGVDTLEHQRGVLVQLLQVDLVDVVQAFAGIREARAAIGIQAVLIDAAGYLGTEFFQQPVTRRQRLMHPAPFRDIDADRQVADP
ncbi:hypothetical protein D3C80_1113020 [compost metagenome]